MNHIQSILSTFSQINATTKRSEKDALLHVLVDIPLAKHLIAWESDPSINFWTTAKDVTDRLYKGTHTADDMLARANRFEEICRDLSNRKITGGTAAAVVEAFLSSCSNMAPYFEATWYTGIFNRHLNIGISSKSIKKVWPDLVSEFGVPLAEPLFEQRTGKRIESVWKDVVFPIVLEPKLDGINVSLIAHNKKSLAQSRGEGLFPAFTRWSNVFSKALAVLSDRLGFDMREWVVNGEFKAERSAEDPSNWNSSWGKTVALAHAGLAAGTFDANRITAYMRTALHRDIWYTVYDTYPYAAYASEQWDCAYGFYDVEHTRSWYAKQIVDVMLEIDPDLHVRHIEQNYCNTWEEAELIHDRHIKEGHEGSMIKMYGAACALRRTTRIQKWKTYNLFDAVVLAVTDGTGHHKGTMAGAWWCYIPDIDDVVKVSVRTDAVKKWALQFKDKMAGYKLEVSEQAKANVDEVVAKTRNPVMVRFRIDAPPEDFSIVQNLCARFKFPVPKERITPSEYRLMTSEFKL